MDKYKKIFYILSAVIGVSSLTAGTVAAGYGNGQAVMAERAANDRDGSLFPGGDCPNCTNDKDGSLFPGGPCKSCTKDGSLFPGSCQKCVKRQRERKVKNYVPYTPIVAEAVARNCCQMAPLALAHVDFRIKKGSFEEPYSSKLGNYRFRIFGCRRFDKEALLNKGRIMEKNIAFNSVFEETVSDCYKVMNMPQDLCLENTPSELPEYVLTAEITDYFMNVCDQYDWDEAQKENARDGSSEITVVWRLMDLTKQNVYWKGESTGYGELYEGEANGEIKLIERAFADAVSNLRNLPGFEEQLMQRVSPEQLEVERQALIDEERALNPMKCGFKKEYECVKTCEISRPGADISQCRPRRQVCPVPVQKECPPVRKKIVCRDVVPAEEPRVIVQKPQIIESGSCSTAFSTISEPVKECIRIFEDGGCESTFNKLTNEDKACVKIFEDGGCESTFSKLTDEDKACVKILEDGGCESLFSVTGKPDEKCLKILEDGGCESTFSKLTSQDKECIRVLEDGGCESTFSKMTAQDKECLRVLEDGGCTSTFSTMSNQDKENIQILEDGGCSSTFSTIAALAREGAEVFENAGVISAHSTAPARECFEVIEDGGCESAFTTVAIPGQECIEIQEDGGCETVYSCDTLPVEDCGVVLEDGGCEAVYSCDTLPVEDCAVVLEDGGVSGDGAAVNVGAVYEGGDVTSSYDVISACIDESGAIREDGMCQVVDDTWIDTGDVTSLDSFCVVDANPCKALTPETIYRLRSSVVQIDSPNGRKGAGLLISDRFVLTSGDLVDKKNNRYTIKTVRNDELKARAVRINPSKNTALMMLEKSVEYTPLALNLSLPEVGRNGYMTLGMLNVNDFKNGEDYLENSARIEGYRYTEDKGAEILVNTFIQNVTVGGALFYKDCTISGMAHSGVRTNDGLDMFIPTETALRSLGINICGHEYVEESPWQQTVYKPVTEQIKKVQKAPEAMPAKERK